jgi:hypothetical protein
MQKEIFEFIDGLQGEADLADKLEHFVIQFTPTRLPDGGVKFLYLSTNVAQAMRKQLDIYPTKEFSFFYNIYIQRMRLNIEVFLSLNCLMRGLQALIHKSIYKSLDNNYLFLGSSPSGIDSVHSNLSWRPLASSNNFAGTLAKLEK